MSKINTLKTIELLKAIAVLRIPDERLFNPIAEALYRGGVRILEITLTVPNAIDLIRNASKSLPDDMLIGVGSILNAEQVRESVDAGAQFVVSPITKKEVIDQAKALDVAVMAGAFTPTEIQQAWEWGSDIVKVFPANITGMDFFKAIKAPLPHLKLMPTGGVTLTNGGDWIKAGACAVGVGSALVSRLDLENRDFNAIEEKARILVEAL
jgi:2-dehydro-3-deoxyphosphogluconate aldolase/(4S)-4-hydroxy-2-oxoglutarate aldolase